MYLHLPNGTSRPLRALIDTGASDDYIHSRVVKELRIERNSDSKQERVSMGQEGSVATTLGDTKPLTLTSGPFCKYKSYYSILELEDYDLILGRPFQRSQSCFIEGDDIILRTRRGPQALPKWATPAGETVKLVRISRAEMIRELKRNEPCYILHPKHYHQEKQVSFEASEGPPTRPRGGLKPNTSSVHARLAFRNIKTTQKQQTTKESLQKQSENTKNEQKHAENNKMQKEEELKYKSPLDDIPRAKGCKELENLLREFRDVFPADLPAELPPEREFDMKIPLKPGNIPPCQAPYRTSNEAQDTIEKTMEYLLSHGLAKESTSEFGAPVLITPKPDGTWRFCTDYRRLNSITMEAKYPLPRIETCLDHLGRARYFSKIDLRSGYWQMRVHPPDIPKTAFRTQYGHYEWLVMPFGLQGAPSAFQRMMNHYLRYFLGKFVQVYLDDILIYSNNVEEHLQHLRQVLTVLREKKLYAKGSKCDLLRQEVLFLGFHVKGGEVHTDLNKIQAIRDWPVPKTVREVRSFLGLCNFYRKFIAKHAQLAKPLTNILKSTEFKEKYGREFTKLAPVTLGEVEVAAFEQLKGAATSAPCLVIYDPTMPTEVWADASWENATTGAVLMQDHGKGLQPVAFLSKVMLKAETHYPTFEQELLALKRALQEWRHYLLPIAFKARTDHNGLKYLKTQKHLSERQWHWLAFFSEYQFELDYRPGKQMVVPDSLSRRPRAIEDIKDLLRLTDDEEDDAVFKITVQTASGKPQKVIFTRKKQVDTPTELPVVFDYTQDSDYGGIYETLKNPAGALPLPSLTLYHLNSQGNLVWIDPHQTPRVCVPKRYRGLLLQELHDSPLGGHFGLEKTYASLRRHYIWPFMRHQAQQYVASCDACQKCKASHQRKLGLPQIPEIPLEPWTLVTLDFSGPFPMTKQGVNMVLVVICNLTKEVMLIPCKNTETGKSTAELYFKYVFKHKGIPKFINCDRGPQFISHFWVHLWKCLGTKVRLPAPYHPQSQANAERQNKTFKENLTIYVNARQDDWDECLIAYEFAYNTAYHSSLGDSPYFLNHGRHPWTPAMLQHDRSSPAASDFVLELNNRLQEARDHVRMMQGRRADDKFPKLTPHNFAVGDLVLLSTENYNLDLPSQKLAPHFLGPLKILELRGPNTVLIEVPPRLARIQPIQNILHLKPYQVRDVEVGPTEPKPSPDLIDAEEEFEVEDIIAHREKKTAKRTQNQYLVRFKGYGPEDDLWLPEDNLKHAPAVVTAYWERQTTGRAGPRAQQQKARRTLARLGHLWC